jgi:hypothetical protein
MARRHPPGRSRRQPPRGGPAQAGATRSARTHRLRGRRLRRRGSNCRRPCCALGSAGTETSWGDPARRRAEARAAQHRRDRGGRDADPELQQLTLDTHVAPARVLPRQPPDQAARLGRKRRTAGPATATSPTSLTQCPVPAAERLRADRKARPSLRREQPAHRSEQGPVDGRVLRPLPSAPEDRQLVAQHDDLKLPLTATAGEHAHEEAQEPVQQTHQHDAQSEPARPRSPIRRFPPGIEFLYPTRRPRVRASGE